MYAYALECNRRLRVSAPLRCLCVQEVHLGVSQNRRKSAWETPCTQVWAHLCISEIEMPCATDEIGRPVPFTCVHCFAQGEKIGALRRRSEMQLRSLSLLFNDLCFSSALHFDLDFLLLLFILIARRDDDFRAELCMRIIRSVTIPVKIFVDEIDICCSTFCSRYVLMIAQQLNCFGYCWPWVTEGFLKNLIWTDQGVVVVHILSYEAQKSIRCGALLHEPIFLLVGVFIRL